MRLRLLERQRLQDECSPSCQTGIGQKRTKGYPAHRRRWKLEPWLAGVRQRESKHPTVAALCLSITVHIYLYFCLGFSQKGMLSQANNGFRAAGYQSLVADQNQLMAVLVDHKATSDGIRPPASVPT